MSTDVSLHSVLTALRCGNPGAKPQFNIWASAGLFFPWHTLQNNQPSEAFRGEFLHASNKNCFHRLMRHKLATAAVKTGFKRKTCLVQPGFSLRLASRGFAAQLRWLTLPLL